MKKTFKVLGILFAVIILAAVIYVVYVFTAYYRLPDKLTLEVVRSGENLYFEEEARPETGKTYRIMTYNVGFGAYLPEYSFFMDGGKYSWAKDEESVLAAISGAGELITEINPDFALIQEVDIDGTRSYHINELQLLNQFIKGYYYDFAQNYDSPFLFFPPWQPHGANKAGIVTYSKSEITDTMRRSFPISKSFSKLIDLDRCYSISRIPLKDGETSLCLYNVHLSAYEKKGNIREEQLAMLMEDMRSDYQNGNYVICGGDFNHDLKAASDAEATVSWAYPLPRESLPEGFSLPLDSLGNKEETHNSSRNADAPYDPATAYTVTLDGIIISDNIKAVSYDCPDLGYRFSDHDPVIMEFILE